MSSDDEKFERHITVYDVNTKHERTHSILHEYSSSCGPNCCDVSTPGVALTKGMIAAHVRKHADGSCHCDACKHYRKEAQ